MPLDHSTIPHAATDRSGTRQANGRLGGGMELLARESTAEGTTVELMARCCRCTRRCFRSCNVTLRKPV